MRARALALTLFAVACGRAPEFVFTHHPEGVIIPEAKAPSFHYSRKPTVFFTPTPIEVERMESQLGAFLRASPVAAPDLYKRAPTYRRRYLGIVVDGQRRIEIEAFCDVPDTLSLSQHLVVFDGGDCVLYVEYDLTRGVFLSFATNGYG